MKRIICLLIITAWSAAAFPVQEEAYKSIIDEDILSRVRSGYYKAVENPDSAEVLLNLLEQKYGKDSKKYNPIIRSYYACLKGLKGKFASNLYVKYDYVSTGVGIINGAVSQFEDCLEIRFLRFSFFYYLPKVFDIDKKMHEDLEYLTKKFKTRDYSFVPPKLQRDMMDFTIQTGLVKGNDYESLLNIIIEIMKMEIDSSAEKK